MNGDEKSNWPFDEFPKERPIIAYNSVTNRYTLMSPVRIPWTTPGRDVPVSFLSPKEAIDYCDAIWPPVKDRVTDLDIDVLLKTVEFLLGQVKEIRDAARLYRSKDFIFGKDLNPNRKT